MLFLCGPKAVWALHPHHDDQTLSHVWKPLTHAQVTTVTPWTRPEGITSLLLCDKYRITVQLPANSCSSAFQTVRSPLHRGHPLHKFRPVRDDIYKKLHNMKTAFVYIEMNITLLEVGRVGFPNFRFWMPLFNSLPCGKAKALAGSCLKENHTIQCGFGRRFIRRICYI